MTHQFRSLGYSLALHTFFISLFFFLLTTPPTPVPNEPIKVSITTFIPQTPQPMQFEPPVQPISPSKPIPKKEPAPITKPILPKPLPIQKPTPKTLLAPQSIQNTPAVPITVQTPEPLAMPIPKKVAPPPPPPPINTEKEFLNAHLVEIRNLLVQNLKYPKMAQKLRMQGDVRVSFSLDNDGKVSNIKVIGSSGFDILDEDAVSLIEKTASRFPKPSESVRISVPLSYTLH